MYPHLKTKQATDLNRHSVTRKRWIKFNRGRGSEGSQRLTQQSGSVYGSEPGPLYIMLWLLAWWFSGAPNSGSRCIYLAFACSEDSSFYWVVLPSLSLRVSALSYCTLFCPVWLSSFGDLLFFSKEETEGEWIWGEGRHWGGWRSGGRENCGWDLLYKRRI